MIPALTVNVTPYLMLLAVVLGSCALVWLGATLYFRRRDQLFWAQAEAMANEPTTEAERAAYEQFDKDFPAEEASDFLDQLMDKAVAQDMPVHMTYDEVLDKAVAQEEHQGEIPLGVVFDGGDGFKYKWVKNPVSQKRVKLKVSGAVPNANSVPMPQGVAMEYITRHQAVDTVDLGCESKTPFTQDDELFFQQVVKAAALGPMPLKDIERSPAPDYTKVEADEERSPDCDVYDEEEGDEPEYDARAMMAVKNAEAVPMPKYMRGLLLQQAEEGAWLGMEEFGKQLAENVPKEMKSSAMAAAAVTVQHFIDKEPVPTVEELASEYEKLSLRELQTHSEAVLRAAQKLEGRTHGLSNETVIKQFQAVNKVVVDEEKRLRDARVSPMKSKAVLNSVEKPKKKRAKAKAKARKKTKK
jgi:hypothetical protein